jgi:hypothetical protein
MACDSVNVRKLDPIPIFTRDILTTTGAPSTRETGIRGTGGRVQGIRIPITNLSHSTHAKQLRLHHHGLHSVLLLLGDNFERAYQSIIRPISALTRTSCCGNLLQLRMKFGLVP